MEEDYYLVENLNEKMMADLQDEKCKNHQGKEYVLVVEVQLLKKKLIVKRICDNLFSKTYFLIKVRYSAASVCLNFLI